QHCRQVALNDRVRNQVCELGENAFVRLNGMKRLSPPVQGVRILLVIRRHPGIEIPAIVVESARSNQGPNIIRRLVLEEVKSDDDIGNLDSGVIDVVLNLDLAAAGTQHTHEGIAENRISNVANVGRL